MIDRFPESFLDDVRAAVLITDVVGQHVQWDDKKSRPGKGDMWACCPFHSEQSPSFHADAQEGSYHCFGCGRSGDHFAFLMEHVGIDFPTAVAEVAGMAGIALPEGTGGGKPARPPEQPRQTKERPQPSAAEIRPEIIKTYDYTDRDGALLYQVCRLQKKLPDGTWARTKDGKGTWKNFLQRRPDGAGKWIWSLSPGEFMRRPGGDWRLYDRTKFVDGMETRFFDAGPTQTIYRHPEVEIAIAEGRPVFIPGGEKDAETLVAMGFCGTTNSSGERHWTSELSEIFRGADVIIPMDNDETGAAGGEAKAMMLRGIAKRVRVLNFADYVPGFPAKGDITDWVEKFGGDAEQLEAMLEGLPDYRPRPPAGFGARTMNSLAGKPIEYDWLIKGLVERNGVFILAAEKQAGKSFVVMDMGMKIARGLQYGDRITRKGIVLHIACEDGKGVQMRAEGYRQANGIGPDTDIPYIVMDRDFTLMNDDVIDQLIAQVKAWEEYYGMPVELIIIDTLSVATEGLNEIDGAEVGKVLARVNRLKDQTGAAICLVHHMNASGARVRGHTSMEANVSQVFEIRPLMTIPQNRRESPQKVLDGEGRHIRQIVLTKNKNGLNDLKWKIVLEVVHLGFDADGDAITTCVCARPARHSNNDAPEDTTKLVGDQKLVFDALVAAQAESTASGPGSGNKAVPMQDFMAAVRKRMSFTAPEEEIEARHAELTSFMKRTTTALINAGYMGRDNDKRICWWTGKSDRPRPQRQELERPQEQPGAGIPEDVKQEIANDPVPF